MSILQIATLGIIGTLFAIQLKQYKVEYAILLCLGIGIVIFSGILQQIGKIIGTIREIAGVISMDTKYMTTILKMLGVTYVAEFTSSICKDAGNQALGSQIEIFSKLTILVLSLPILVALLKTIQGFFV